MPNFPFHAGIWYIVVLYKLHICSFPVMSRKVSIAEETTYWSPKTQRNQAGTDLEASSLWAGLYNVRKYYQCYWRRKEIINLPRCKICERQ